MLRSANPILTKEKPVIKRNLKNSKIKEERAIYKKYRRKYLKKKQSKARSTKSNNTEIKRYQANIRRARYEIELYLKAIDVLIQIQKATKGK